MRKNEGCPPIPKKKVGCTFPLYRIAIYDRNRVGKQRRGTQPPPSSRILIYKIYKRKASYKFVKFYKKSKIGLIY